MGIRVSSPVHTHTTFAPDMNGVLGPLQGVPVRRKSMAYRTVVAILVALIEALIVGGAVVVAGGPVWAAIGFACLTYLIAPRVRPDAESIPIIPR